jgi:hypothetical protein
MDNISMEAARNAVKLFIRLLEKSRIRKADDSALFEAYEDVETASLISIFEEEAGIMLLRTGDTIYYTPRTDNRFLGFTNEELRKSMNLSNNTELYLCYIIILSIMVKFYNGENYNVKCRTLLRVEELEKFITTKIQALGMREDGEKEDEQLGFNFSAASKVWLELPAYDEKITNYARSSGTRISYIYKTLNFLKEQGLIDIDRDNDIFTTEKLDIMATGFYPENGRKKELLSYLDGFIKGGGK